MMKNTSKLILVPYEKYTKLLELNDKSSMSAVAVSEVAVPAATISTTDETNDKDNEKIKEEFGSPGRSSEDERAEEVEEEGEGSKSLSGTSAKTRYVKELVNSFEVEKRALIDTLLANIDPSVWEDDGSLKQPFEKLKLKEVIADLLGEKSDVTAAQRKLIKRFIYTDTSITPAMVANGAYRSIKRRKLSGKPRIINWINC